MKNLYTLRAAALASVCLLPLAAAAQEASQYDAEIDLGLRGQTKTSPVFGRYNGFVKDGAQALGGFSVKGGSAWDSGATDYFRIEGRDLDYTSDHFAPEGSVSVKGGNQGKWSGSAYYDAISYTGQQFYSAFAPAKNGLLGLQNGFQYYGGSPNPATAGPFTSVSASGATGTFNPMGLMALQQAGTRRDIFGGDVKFNLGDWTFSTGFKSEHKSGSLLQTIDASAAGLAFGQPVDYTTNRYTAQLAYAARGLQGVLSYTYSKFEDGLESVMVPYFTSKSLAVTSGTGTAFTTNQQTASFGTPPSNDAHYLNGSLGYDINDYTRMMGNFRVGVEMQNAPMTTGTGIVFPTGSIPANNLLGNPGSAGLAARVYGGNLTASSQPITHLDLRASYFIDGRSAGWNNKITGASGSSESNPSVNSLVSFGQDWTKQQGNLQAGYRLLPSTKLTLGYSFDRVDRDLSMVSHSNTNTGSVKLTSTPITNLVASVGYEHSSRNGSTQYYYVGGTPAAASTVVTGLTQLYGGNAAFLSVPYYQAARDADILKLRTDYKFSDSIAAGVNGKLASNNYHYPVGLIGVARDMTASIGPDVSYTPSKDMTAHLFYTYEEIYRGDRGAGVAYDLNGHFGDSASTSDQIHTVGVSGDWKINDRLKLLTSYTFYYGAISYELFNGLTTANTGIPTSTNVNVANLPNVNSSMHSLKLQGEYQVSPNVELAMGYTYDMFKDQDWSYNYPAAFYSSSGSGAVSLSSGETNPSYHVHSVFSAVRVKF